LTEALQPALNHTVGVRVSHRDREYGYCFRKCPNKIQGIGPNFVPGILDRKAFDAVEDVEYDAAIAMQRRLTREEGLLSGISTGAIVAAAAKVSAVLGPGKTVVCILCDTGERYLTHELYANI